MKIFIVAKLSQELTAKLPNQVYLDLLGSSTNNDTLYSTIGLKDQVGVYASTRVGNELQITVQDIIQGSDIMIEDLMNDTDIQVNSTAL